MIRRIRIRNDLKGKMTWEGGQIWFQLNRLVAVNHCYYFLNSFKGPCAFKLQKTGFSVFSTKMCVVFFIVRLVCVKMYSAMPHFAEIFYSAGWLKKSDVFVGRILGCSRRYS